MILYLHGFNSAPSSHKARLLAAYMQGRGLGAKFRCPALPHEPRQAIALAEAELALHGAHRVTLVGSSLGGFYATFLAEKHDCRAALVQPAVSPYVGLESFLGKQRNLYTGAEYELTRADLDSLRALAVQTVQPQRYLVLLETGDEVLDYREAVRKYAGASMVIREGGDHAFQSFPEQLQRIVTFAGLDT